MKLLVLFLLTLTVACSDSYPTNVTTGSSHEHEELVCTDLDQALYLFEFDNASLGDVEVLFDSPTTFRQANSGEVSVRGSYDTDTCKVDGVTEFRRYGHWKPGPAFFGEVEASGGIYGSGFFASRIL